MLLLRQALLETLHVHTPALLCSHQLRQVDGETVGIEQFESKSTVNHPIATLCLGHIVFETANAVCQSLKERLLLLQDNAADKLLLLDQLGVLSAHLTDQCADQFVDKRLFEAQESVAVAHCTAQDAANHVARLGIAGQLPVGNAEADGTQVVGHHAHRHIRLFVLAIHLTRLARYLLYQRLKHVGVVVRLLALHHHAEAFKAHTRVDMFRLQRFQRAVGKTVILHKHQVPYLNHQRVILVHQLRPWHTLLLLLVAQVDMYLAARAAGTLVAHFPEVVLLRPLQNAALVHMLLPIVVGLGVHCQPLLLVAAKHCHVEVRLVDAHHLGEELPAVGDSLLLKIVAKAPVAQHLKHSVVVGIVSHLLQVVMLTAHAEALLSVSHPGIGCARVAEKDILKLVHTGISKHQSGVVLHHHRSARHNVVPMALKKMQKTAAYFVACHDYKLKDSTGIEKK